MSDWKAIKWSSHAATSVVVDDPTCYTGKRVVAECDTEEEARLIAAAPELLEVLGYWLTFIDSESGDERQRPWVERAHAVYAKAKGTSA